MLAGKSRVKNLWIPPMFYRSGTVADFSSCEFCRYPFEILVIVTVKGTENGRK